MELAPYGVPRYRDVILDKVLDLKEDGTFRLNMEYFNYATGLTMTNDKFHRLLGAPPRTHWAAKRFLHKPAGIEIASRLVVTENGAFVAPTISGIGRRWSTK